MTAFRRAVDELGRRGQKVIEDKPDRHAKVQCPLDHDNGDRDPSLSITRIEGGIMLVCHCTPKDAYKPIADWLGWPYGELLHDDPSGKMTYRYQDGGRAVRSYDDKGKKQIRYYGRQKDRKTVLFHADRITEARAKGEPVFLVGSEKDVLALESLSTDDRQIYATCAPMGEGNWHLADHTPLHGCEVIAIAHRDEQGTRWAQVVQVDLEPVCQLGFMLPAVDREKADAADHVAEGYTLAELVPWVPPDGHLANPEIEDGWSRWVDLRPYLSGERASPEPSVGARRDDGIALLYERRWHTDVALTGAGKTAFGLWHANTIMFDGDHVIYLHFEEPEPDGIIDRLRRMGVSDMMIDTQFHWADCSRSWSIGEMDAWLSQFDFSPRLAILDGTNAACSQHGWDHGDPSAIGFYRSMWVTPLVKAGAAVLSLGHPPKARDRQNEIHGFGSTAWLDEVDGIGFRMVASKDRPMVIGGKGDSALYVVKDRYSQVKRWGNLDATRDQPWWYMGALVVDDTVTPQEVRLNIPPAPGSAPPSKESILAGHVKKALEKRTGRFESVRNLRAMLAEDSITYTTSHLEVALEILTNQGWIEWPEVPKGNPRPGWLVTDNEPPEELFQAAPSSAFDPRPAVVIGRDLPRDCEFCDTKLDDPNADCPGDHYIEE